MTAVADWRSSANPGALFVALWAEVGTWASHRRSDCRPLPNDIRTRLEDHLIGEASALKAVSALLTDIDVLWRQAQGHASDIDSDSLLLGVMSVIDEVFLRVHPRTVRLSGAVARGGTPAWLQDAGERRTLDGAYAETSTHRLIARGPLSRPARSVLDVNAESLTHHFVGLTVAPRATTLDDSQSLPIRCCVIGHGAARGVPPAPPGREVVGFAPLAEIDADLVYTERRDENDRPFLDVSTAPGSDLADRLVRAVGLLGPMDLLVAPELTLDASASARFAAALDPQTAPRLSIAGSGAGGQADEKGRRFNTASAYNALGARLWSHQKVWPYGMGEAQVDTCRLFQVRPGELLMEDIQAGVDLTVADLDGFGRVLMLICQDFQIRPAIEEVIRTYQPDWVVVPIMDRGVGASRWMHATANALAELSPARFVVVSSLSLAERSGAKDYPNTPVALMVGPTRVSQVERDLGGISRAAALLSCTEVEPRCGKAQWNDRSATWRQNDLGIK